MLGDETTIRAFGIMSTWLHVGGGFGHLVKFWWGPGRVMRGVDGVKGLEGNDEISFGSFLVVKMTK